MRKRVYTAEQKARRNRQWYESMARTGKMSICPGCGKYTKCASGFCRACAKKELSASVKGGDRE